MVADYRMEKNKERRRQDLMERLRVRFSQYQKRHAEVWTRFASNGPVKEERERHDTQLYQQRILNARANSKPRPKQDQTAKSSSEATYPPPNAMGDTLILQQLKRRFDETFQQAQDSEDFEERSPNKTARSDEEQRNDLIATCQQGNIINNLSRTMQVKNDPNDLSLGPSLTKQKQLEDVSGSAISQRNSHATTEKDGEMMDVSSGIRSLAEEQPHPGNDNSPTVSSNCHVNQKTNTVSLKSEVNALDQGSSDFPTTENRGNSNDLLQNGGSHISSDGNLNDILKDWEDDIDDMFPNISDDTQSTTSSSQANNIVKSSSTPAKSRERKELKNTNHNMISQPLSHSSTFQNNTSLQQQNNLGHAPPYPSNVAGGQLRPQAPPPMGIGPQIRRYLVDHIQGRGRQQIGPGSYASMGGMSVRDNMIAGSQTKNPETIAKVQEHLLIKKQMHQRQMEMARQQMQQQMQQPFQQTYQQQLIQMAQAAQQHQQPAPSPMSPMMQPMSPHIQQQAFMQQNISSPIPSPMATTPHMNRNPFQFPQDYNAYINQQKQMQGFDSMGNMQSPLENSNHMSMNYFPGPKQDPSRFPVRQQMPSQNLHHGGMQPNTVRPMFGREHMFSADGMPHNQIMPNHLGPAANFQQPQVPKPPPQYTQNNFSPPAVSAERQQLQRSVSNARNRLSHFSHPDEVQNMNIQNTSSLKSPGTLPIYPGNDNNMFPPMGVSVSSMGNSAQQGNLLSSTHISDSTFNNFQSYGPPNMNLSNPVNTIRTSVSPNNWADESQLQKQHSLQQSRLNSEFRPSTSKVKSLNLANRHGSMTQSRQIPAPFSPPIEKIQKDVSHMASNQMAQLQQPLLKASVGSTMKQQSIMQDTSRLNQISNESDDFGSILIDPPDNFDLVKNLLD